MLARSKRVLVPLAALAILAAAFFLRVYRLADQNIWWDEGWTVWLARHDWTWIALRTASDEHPPLHYWLMNLWQSLLGTSTFIAAAFEGRFFSLAFGVLGIAVVYRLGKAIGGARIGLLAALFLALARFQVWWSQDIKNYTLSAFFAWVSVWMTWELFFPRRARSSTSTKLYWLGYVLATALALYSHYLAALIFLANNLFVGIVLLARWRGGTNPLPLFWRWALAQIAALGLFIPWLYLYLQNGATWTAAPAFDLGLFLRLAATVLTLGVTTFIENYTWIVLGLLLIAGLSLGWIIRGLSVARRSSSLEHHPSSVDRLPTRSSRLAWGTVFALLILLIPPALIYLLSLTPAAIFAPKIQARYLMMLTPAFALLLALGVMFIAQVWRGRYAKFAAAALVVLVVLAQLYTLNDYFDGRMLQDEYATLAQMVNNFGLDGDAVVLDTDQEYPTFLFYLDRPFDWIGVPNGAPVDAGTAQRIAAQTEPYHAVWVVTIPDALQKDPQRLVEQQIAARLPKRYEQTFGDKRLTLYADTIRNVKDAPRATFTPQVAHNDAFDDRLSLVGADVPVREALAGDVVRVVTYWRAEDLYTINLVLQTASGQEVAKASIPISIGARERAEGDLQVPPDLDASTLRVVAQAKLKALPIGTVNVLGRAAPSDAATGAPAEVHTEKFGANIQLVGTSLPTTHVRAGDTIPLTLFWKTDAPVSTSYTVFVHLLGTQYNPAQKNLLWGQVDQLPLGGKLPTTAWSPGQTIADPYALKVDDHAPAGTYKLEIGLYDAATGARLRVYNAGGKDVGDSLIVGQVTVGD